MGNRILSLQIEIVDKNEATWIWESHINRQIFHGVYIRVIQEGVLPSEFDDDEEF